MMPRLPTDLNHNVVTSISPGQNRFLALDQAVRFAISAQETSTDAVVQAAEKFYEFLTPDSPQDGSEVAG